MKTQYDYWKEDHDRVMAEMAATMNYSIHETRDNRYFKYGIQVLKSMLDFHNVRRWFTETYGVGDDIGRDDPLINGHWAFQIHYTTYMIYVKGDEELTWFKIRHGDPQ